MKHNRTIATEYTNAIENGPVEAAGPFSEINIVEFDVLIEGVLQALAQRTAATFSISDDTEKMHDT